MAGIYINFTFAEHGVRFIAANDNYDAIEPGGAGSDFAGIRNRFYEFYACDTGRKIRAVSKAKGERGERPTAAVPYGYMKNPDNPKERIVNEETARAAREIFKLCFVWKNEARTDCRAA